MAWWKGGGKAATRRSFPARIDTMRGVTAAAQRFDLTKEADRKRLAKAQEQWQTDAWFYVDTVGEAINSRRFIANSFRRVRLYAAFQRDPDAEAIAVGDATRPTDSDAEMPTGEEVATTDPGDFLPEQWALRAEEIVAGFSARDGGQAVLMERLGVNLFVPGECYLINRKVPARAAVVVNDPAAPNGARLERPGEIEQADDWEVRAADEIRVDPQATLADAARSGVMLVDGPDQRDGIPLAPDAFIERVWRKHPRWSAWADSNFRAAIGTLEELDLLARLARVSLRSRLVAGFITFPDELDFGAADAPAGEGEGGQGRRVSLDRDLAELWTSVIGDETDVASVAPVPLRGPKEFLDGVKHVPIPARYGETEMKQYDAAVARFGRTIELPADALSSVADMNHWNVWQVSEETYEAYIEPLVTIGTEALTFGLLRPLLAQENCPPEFLERLVVAADASQLVRRPDRGKVAAEGHGMFALSDEAWRKANGFGVDDAPSDDELRRRLAIARGLIAETLTTLMLEQAGIVDEGATQVVADAAAAKRAANAPGAAPDDEEADTEEAPPEEEQAAAAHAAIVAAAGQQAAAQSLGLADRVLRERLLVTFDAALSRALDRAGARLRTRSQRVTEARATLNAAGTVANADVGRVLGPALVAAIASDSDLFGDAFVDLRDRFDSWVGDTQAAALDTLAAVAGAELTTEVRASIEAEQAEDRDEAWDWVLGALLALATARVRGDAPAAGTEDGEFDPAIAVPPGLVREALAIAGGEAVERSTGGGLTALASGEPVGGPSTGSVIRRAFAATGFPWSGYVWNYGLAPRQRPFEPHRALAGLRFSTWTSPELANEAGQWPGVAFWHPGDHWYCRCDFAPVISEASAASAYPEQHPSEED